MIKAIWKLFLALIAKPANSTEAIAADKIKPIKHYYPIPENIQEFSNEEIRNYANDLAGFILNNVSNSPTVDDHIS
jgi:hypothetical protein